MNRYPLYAKYAERFLFPQQHDAVRKLTRSRGGIVWWKVGEGKTRIALFLFAALQNAYRWALPSICLVVCRKSAFQDWEEEIRRCFYKPSVYTNDIPVHPPGRKPVFLLISAGDMARGRKRKGKTTRNQRFAALQNNPMIRFVVIDELWMYANNKSERSKCAHLLTRNRFSAGLSGTIMKARDTCEVYNQASAVQKHRFLAPSLTKFRSLYQKSIQIGNEHFPRTVPRKGSYKKIMRSLREVASIHFPEGDRLIHEQFHTIEPTPKQLQYFHELKEFYSIEELDLEYDHAIVISVKAQQIADGWIKTDEGIYRPVPSNKAEKLWDEVSDIVTAGHSVVVWCAFRHDVKMLARHAPFAVLQMLSGHPFDLDAWRRGDARVCLATEASGSSVNHFANTPYAIYYSSNFKWLDMQQSRGRTDRGRASQHSTCFYKYLQVAGSLDSHVYRTTLASGRDERKLITEGVADWIKST